MLLGCREREKWGPNCKIRRTFRGEDFETRALGVRFLIPLSMKRRGSAAHVSPEDNCAFCLVRFRRKPDRRPVAAQKGDYFISGVKVVNKESKFIDAKFACQKCFGEACAEWKVLPAPVTPYHSYISLDPSFHSVLCVFSHVFPDARACADASVHRN